MDVFSALQTAVSGLKAQSFSLSNISGNIANSQTTGYKRKTTTTTWYLEHVKLVGVQTPGVANVTADEDPDGDEED